MWKIGVVTLLAVLGWSASGNDDSCLRPIASAPPGYEHNRFGVGSSDQLREFSAYVVSFDRADDDNGAMTCRWRKRGLPRGTERTRTAGSSERTIPTGTSVGTWR